ncbi:MAG: metallophosphoesterase [Solirubrobacterales bacterium]|nr:metallophosphoesterase [Solirubrobacterales bacterium]
MFKRRQTEKNLRLFYAGDVHGSRVCWKKFVNAAAHYPADALVMGGDLTGKALVPIVREGDGSYSAEVIGERRLARTAEELDEIQGAIATNGMYPLIVDRDEAQLIARDSSHRAEAFERVLLDELRLWVEFADERLAGTDTRAYVIPGNDDPWSVDAVLEAGTSVDACDEAIRIVGPHEMVSFGYANRTPWDTPRELDEDEIYSRLKVLVDQLETPESAILNIHVPPRDSSLDTAFEVDEELRYVTKGGRPHEVPTGSSGVRQIIEETQPLLSLHGHIHESKGVTQIGRTVAINPGSDYGSGHLDGCLVHLAPTRVVNKYLVSG